MSEEIPIDAESSTRNQNYDSSTHLKHLLKIGHAPDSALIKLFVIEHNLQEDLKEFIKKNT
jgi:hypothetical protein